MKKRLLSILLGGALLAGSTLGVTACSGKSNKITLWGPSAQQESLKEMVAQFLEENPDFGLEIELGVAGEGDAYSMMSNDAQSGADVFAYANDQVVKLISLGALARLNDATVTELKSSNVLASVEAGKVGDYFYGYPYAADNGFFMFYDSSVVSEDDAKTLEGVLAACKAKKKYFLYQLTTGWYAGSFIYGAGGEYTAIYDGLVVSEVICNFDEKAPDSNYTYGELGGQQLIDLRTANDYVVDGDDTQISNYLNAKGGSKLGACITGTWNAKLIQSKLQTTDEDGNLVDHYAATTLPTWKSSLDGKTYNWKSFAGYKLYGVNAYSKHIDKAHQLAAFLSSEKMQEKRFDDNQIGPSNTKVAALPKVTENLAISTINKQIATNSVIQRPTPDAYWTEMESFANAMKTWGTPSEKEDEEEPVVTTLADRVKKLVSALKG